MGHQDNSVFIMAGTSSTWNFIAGASGNRTVSARELNWKMPTAVADHDPFRLWIPKEVNPQRATHRILDSDLQVLPHDNLLAPVAEGTSAPGRRALLDAI